MAATTDTVQRKTTWASEAAPEPKPALVRRYSPAAGFSSVPKTKSVLGTHHVGHRRKELSRILGCHHARDDRVVRPLFLVDGRVCCEVTCGKRAHRFGRKNPDENNYFPNCDTAVEALCNRSWRVKARAVTKMGTIAIKHFNPILLLLGVARACAIRGASCIGPYPQRKPSYWS